MKKLRILLILFLSLFIIFATYVQADEINDTFAGARYVEETIIEENYLPYGVKQVKVHGQTSTSMSGYDADGYGGDTKLVVPGELYDQQVNVMEVPSDEKVKITTWAYLNGHKWSLNTVRSLILDYEDKHPGWKVVGAINGDFFDINAKGALPYQTSGALVSGGEFYKTTSGNTVGFRNDGSSDPLVGNEEVERTPYMILSVYGETGEIIKEFPVEHINSSPEAGKTSVFYSYYVNEEDGVDNEGNPTYKKVFIEKNVSSEGFFVDKAELALPNDLYDFYGKGKISSTTAKTLGVGEFAIVSNNEEVKEYLDTDVTIRVQYQYIGAYEGVNDITGGGTTIIADGQDSGISLTDRAPRTVIGRKADGTIIMMVIDGRQSAYGMYGADRTELGAIMNYYGAVEAYNLDGGGSSTMIIKKDGEFVVLNSPSDGRERTDANAILIVVQDPEIEILETASINSLAVDVNLIRENNHDINELYFTLNNETKKVENNQVFFGNLNSNTEYSYKIEYKDSNGKLTQILTSGKFKTYKLTPTFEGLTIIDRGDKYEVILDFIDPDNASGYAGAGLELDGKPYGYFYQGLKTINKSLVEEFNSIKIITFVNIGDGNNERVTLIISEFEIEFGVDGVIYKIFEIQNSYATKVFR